MITYLLGVFLLTQVRFVLRQLTAMCNPMIAVDEREFLLSHKSVVSFGRAKYDSQSSLHYFCESVCG